MGKINIRGFSLLAFCVFLAIVGMLTPGVHSCSPPVGPLPPDTAESRIHYAETVLYGIVIQHYTDSQASFNSFTAEMEVTCIFKGAPVPQVINVTNAGFMGGMCFSTKLDIGKFYVVFLSHNGEAYSPVESDIEVTGINDPYLSNVTRVCDLSTQYPTGVNEFSTRQRCPQTDQTLNCVRHKVQLPTVHTEVMPPHTTETDLKNYPGPEVKVDTSTNTGQGPSDGGHRFNLNSILGVSSLIAIFTFIR